ncbi:hypothetical protein CQ14_01650 [Bradyrhizobium lablabi]|uniref:Uncharacterized protein n=1 Tax=Bradyrhizobium lablabi TaxID=722472 RepID=A0A0R3MT03_9BRAD|nr:hypothetical protein CQ14_01650 [Bradyrhizobium lablabi]
MIESRSRGVLDPRLRGDDSRVLRGYLLVIACDKREAFAQGSEATKLDERRRKQSIYPRAELWIASRSLSSGAHSCDPLGAQ